MSTHEIWKQHILPEGISGKNHFVPPSVIKPYFNSKQKENLPNSETLQGKNKCIKYLHNPLTGILSFKMYFKSNFKVSRINITISHKK